MAKFFFYLQKHIPQKFQQQVYMSLFFSVNDWFVVHSTFCLPISCYQIMNSLKIVYILFLINGDVTYYLKKHLPWKFHQQVCMSVFLNVKMGGWFLKAYKSIYKLMAYYFLFTETSTTVILPTGLYISCLKCEICVGDFLPLKFHNF